MKFEKARILKHLTDAFAAVAVVFAWAPYYYSDSGVGTLNYSFSY